jgi:type III pantothenate kinase
MLLAIDVGNTNITFGLFDEKKLVKQWRCLTGALRVPSSKFLVTRVIICSVVPSLDQKLKTEVQRLFGIKPFFITAENISGIKVKVKNKREVGADRVVNALAAYKLYGGPCIVVDFGTATTFDVVSSKGEYLGGAIAPGIALARDALYNQTAKLPRVEIKAPRSVIGKDTVSAMQSGLVYGYVSLVEGMIRKLRFERRELNVGVIATGGYAPLICRHTKIVDRVDQDLTLKGLRLVGENLSR